MATQRDIAAEADPSRIGARLSTVFQRPAARDLFLVVLCVAVFATLKAVLYAAEDQGIWPLISVPAVILALCIALSGARASELAPAANIVVRVVAMMLGLYSVAAVITYPSHGPDAAGSAIMALRALSYASVVCAVVAFWRPAFAMVPPAVVFAKKGVAEQLFGIGISATDYTAVLEMCLLLGVGAMVLGLVARGRSGGADGLPSAPDTVRASALLFMVAVASHFSNYFYSAIQKMSLGGGWFDWALNNPTSILSANAWVGGFLPLAAWPGFGATGLATAEALVPVINWLTLIGQLAAVVFIARRITMIGLTLFYDLTHVVIFLVSGIFFWKWIILNLALVAAMRRLPGFVETRLVVAVSVATVVLAPHVFTVVRLGWYDTPALTTSQAYAVTRDGRELAVPSNYFGTVSVTAAQHRLGRPAEGHFPTVTWGTTQSLAVYRQATTGCAETRTDRHRFAASPEKIARIVQAVHAHALEREARTGGYRYDLFPHHIWSNPLLYRDFAALAPSEIDHFLYRTISGCVTVDGEPPVRDVMVVDEIRIPALAAGDR